MRCDFRTRAECACRPDACRASRPLVHLDERLSSASRSFHRATIAALTVSIASVFVLAAVAWEAAERRVVVAMQEETHVRK